MKILTFSTLYPNAARPIHGIFVETRLRQLLASGEVESKVVAPVPWFPWRHPRFGEYALHANAPHEELRHGIEVVHPRYPVVPKLGMTMAPFLLAQAVAPTLQRMLKRYPFDLIDAHYFYPDGVAAVMLGRRLNKPVVVTARGSDINLIAQYRLPRRMIQWAARHAAGMVTVSRALKDGLAALKIPTESICVMRNGVDLGLFSPVDREALRERLGLKRRTLLSVGNLLACKGHDIVIHALTALSDCELVIVGAGPEHRALGALAMQLGVKERVRLAGLITQDQLREYYGAADALILMSSREGWPNVLLEAIACGTPVIATDVGGSSQIVAAPEAGLLLRERNPQALAQAVRHLLSHYPDRHATGRYAEKFSWAATTRNQLELFRRVIAANSGAVEMRAAGAS